MVIAFDLDDTLVPEMDYVESAYRAIARSYGDRRIAELMMDAPSPREAFDATGLPVEDLLDIYRTHIPDIRLPWESLYTLTMLKNSGHRLALVTDGRASTQRNKIAALGLDRFIAGDMIFISGEVGEEKTGGTAFRRIMQLCPGEQYIYVGDNPVKDVADPLSLGWEPVVLLSRGRNIHPQDIGALPPGVRVIKSLLELLH